ncbi:uncharacterized protein LOC113294677 [Papaver somniferum]|uniref:uncharacterized protein LOC113294677 n=1 Tax=Papaver somniferum TaxID=3469 RepID=UPI000E6FBE5B|nr:uncharacterized protein LOC113294677 [Papaver somniferum]
MAKVFDRVDWSFLMAIMKPMGFSDKWCNLLHHYISTTNMVGLVNGDPGKFLRPSRGLKQGDPLSLYLFIFYRESLSRSLVNAEQLGLIHGTQISPGALLISHLLFADDCMVFYKANMNEYNNLVDIFSSSSGQMINFFKYGIFFSKNTNPDIVNNSSNFMHDSVWEQEESKTDATLKELEEEYKSEIQGIQPGLPSNEG